MDFVLDRLLQSLLELVPWLSAHVCCSWRATHASCGARKIASRSPNKTPDYPLTLDRRRLSVPLAHINGPEQCLACRHENRRKNGPASRPYQHPIMACVPLVASQQTLGAFGGPHPAEHLHTRPPPATQLLAIPRLSARSRILASTERAEIFGSELQRRLTDLRQREALGQSEEGRRVSETSFKRFFVPVRFRFPSRQSMKAVPRW